MRKYLINAVNGFRDGKEPPHLVRDPAKNHFPHVDVIADIIPANVHWSQYYPHLTSAGVSTSAADTLDDPEFREPLATGVGKE